MTCGRSSPRSSPRRWLISLSTVCKRYPGGKDALVDVSLAIEAGAFAFIGGPSGAGKSTRSIDSLAEVAAALGENPLPDGFVISERWLGGTIEGLCNHLPSPVSPRVGCPDRRRLFRVGWVVGSISVSKQILT